MELESTVIWYCDGCEKFINTQIGFDNYKDEWKCNECGYINNIRDKNILDE